MTAAMPAATGAQVHAAIAVIERRGRVLICRRRASDDLGGLWEFPGGKREPGETWERCVRRELLEELGVHIRSLRFLSRIRYYDGERWLVFRVFRCAIASGTPHPYAADALSWVRVDRLHQYRFPPANTRLVRRLAVPSST